MSELNDEILDVVEDGNSEDVTEDDIRDSLVITVPIDSTLSISGAAADARAAGQALNAKASESDVKTLLSVNGRTGNGGWAIMVNGGNIPASSDTDTEMVSDALDRISGALTTEQQARSQADTAMGTRIDGLATRVGTEETARANADTALDGRIGVLEGQGLAERIAALEDFNTIKSIVTAITDADGTYFTNKASNVTITALTVRQTGRFVSIWAVMTISGDMVANYFYGLINTTIRPKFITRVPAIGHNSSERGQILGVVSIADNGEISFAPNVGGSGLTKAFRFYVSYMI